MALTEGYTGKDEDAGTHTLSRGAASADGVAGTLAILGIVSTSIWTTCGATGQWPQSVRFTLSCRI